MTRKSKHIRALLTTFFDQVTEEQMQAARAKTGIGHLPRGVLNHLLDDQRYSVEDLVTLLIADAMVRQDTLREKSERLAALETHCADQQRAIDDIADQSLKLRALMSRLFPDQDPVAPFDILKNAALNVEPRQ